MEAPVHQIVAIAGGVIGLIFGITVQRTNFCMMGAVADLALSGSTLRLRAWALAIAVALIGTQLLSYADLLDTTESIYLRPNIDWLVAIVGGI